MGPYPSTRFDLVAQRGQRPAMRINMSATSLAPSSRCSKMASYCEAEYSALQVEHADQLGAKGQRQDEARAGFGSGCSG